MVEEFEWSEKLGNMNSQRSIDPANLLGFPVVCEVLAVPGQKVIDVPAIPLQGGERCQSTHRKASIPNRLFVWPTE